MILLLAVACAPLLDDPTPYVTAPRVLAVATEPPEAEAGDPFTLTALYAGPEGEIADAPVDWAFCVTPRPLAELGPVARRCLDAVPDVLEDIGTGSVVDAVVPQDACSLFGPNPPPPVDGQPAGRPQDPDVTGGYYQPILGFSDEGTTLAAERVRCGIANVSQEVYVAWNAQYVSNTNPVPTLDVPGEAAPGEEVAISVDWGTSAEAYVVYDPTLGTLVDHREAISAAWYATAGVLDLARSGRDGDDTASDLDNTWTAPGAPGTYWLAVAVRDERGGVGWASASVTVAP